MVVRVKICGIRTHAEAGWAVAAGASAVGFVFAPSPRRITPEEAAAISQGLPPFVARVGVFVNEDPVRVARVAEDVGLDAVQLHGEEPPENCRFGGGLKVIKAIRVDAQEPEELVVEARRYAVDAVLLDARVPDRYGGSGQTFDWHKAAAFRRLWPGPVILAGGLSPANVCEAVRLVRPYAVDVSSGVECAGRKDPALIKQFMSLIHCSNYENAAEGRKRQRSHRT